MKLWMTAALAALIALPGCARTDDPAKGGFFSGIANMSDGTYERRQQERKEALENAQDINQQKQRELERTNAQRDAVAKQRAQVEAQAASLEKEVAALKSKLAAAKTQRGDLQRQADILQAKIDVLKQDTFTPPADKQARLDALTREKADLEKQIDTAIGR